MRLQRYYTNLFVSTVIDASSCRLFAQAIKNKRIVKTFEAVFENEDDDEIDEKVINYIKDISKKYKACYLSFCLTSIGQGAFSGRNFRANSVDKKSVTPINMHKDWTVYASYIDINWAKNMFKPLKLDLLYSPFVFLGLKVQARESEEKITLYIYSLEDSFALAIFKKKKFLHGGYFRTKQKPLELDEIDEKAIDIDNIEEFDTEGNNGEEDYESFEDLDDTLDFDANEEVDFSENKNEDVVQLEDKDVSIEYFGRDMSMYIYILDSIKEFYASTAGGDGFIENIVIYDDSGKSETVVNMLKSEQFMNVECEEVNILKEMNKIAIKDVNL